MKESEIDKSKAVWEIRENVVYEPFLRIEPPNPTEEDEFDRLWDYFMKKNIKIELKLPEVIKEIKECKDEK